MISLSAAECMSSDISDDTLIPTTDGEPLDVYVADPIVVSAQELLDGVVGPLTGIEVGRVSAKTVAWAGVDAAGSVRSGTASLDVGVGEDGRSLVLGWRVDVDETPTE